MSDRYYASILVQGVWFDVRVDDEYGEGQQVVQRRFRDWAMSESTSAGQLHTDGGTEVWVAPSAIGAVKL